MYVTTCTESKRIAPLCSICLEDIKEDQLQLKCQHIFHKNCIEPWLAFHDTCPLDRSYVGLDGKAPVYILDIPISPKREILGRAAQIEMIALSKMGCQKRRKRH